METRDNVFSEFPDFQRRKDTNLGQQGGLIIVVIQDYGTKQVLMQGYMDRVAWHKTRESGYVWLWSTNRAEFYLKGAVSGNTMKVKQILVNCDRDCALIMVKVLGSEFACHQGRKSCFLPAGYLRECPNCYIGLKLTSRKFKTSSIHYTGEDEEIWYCLKCGYEE